MQHLRSGHWAQKSILPLLGVVALAAGGVQAEEVSLRYTLSPDGPPIGMPGQKMLASDAPLQVVKLPPLRSQKPLYLTASLGEGADRSVTFVLDESEPGAGYDLLYADTHRRRDLSAEEPYRLTRWGFSSGFKPVRLLIDIGGRPTLFHAAVVTEDFGTSTEYRLQSWTHYTGEVKFGEKSYPASLIDANANGRFNDPCRELHRDRAGDILLMDVNGDGRFEQGEFASPEYRPLARRIQVDGRCYDLEIRADGSGLQVAPAAAPLATLRSDSGPFALALASDGGILTLRGENGQTQLPVGDYQIMGWQVEQRDVHGKRWIVQGSQERLSDQAPRLSVKSDTLLPQLGSPLQAQLDVQPAGGREFHFQLRFTTASGAVIGQVSCNGQPMPVPRLRILDARGKAIANLPFHYG